MSAKLTSLFALALLSMTGTALAGERCDVPQDQWQPQAALEKKLTAMGWEIKRIKHEEGCYEVYALDAEGQRREVYFDPATLESVGGEDD
ncbi:MULTISPECIES: PepSY domain-containing protein [unclassified Modicisalibacter]|uniref:PepSY domain-containing protein n=1 Tax=unclassified Modicisalibacter TaxID=2679913 RepID=UPI001CCA81E8|nr:MULTISPECIES: PepSY domain-containing protein [unclassified Modicisalibacter]MBZ9557859.1 PepSY domain-containing protein [Modicisalibacter sp. R2A 31.J]MBZ9573475.1 PepSY domain-containing protein [Modicisalibacter sp. MOD 31.J]